MASTAISKNFSPSKHRKIAVLPFQNNGQSGTDSQIADKLSLRLMERGFTIVERSQLERVFEEVKLNYTGALSQAELKKIGKVLSVDMIIMGTLQYAYAPSQTTLVGNYASSTEGYLFLQSETARFIDIETGEVLINSFCCDKDIGENGKINEIASSIELTLQNR